MELNVLYYVLLYKNYTGNMAYILHGGYSDNTLMSSELKTELGLRWCCVHSESKLQWKNLDSLIIFTYNFQKKNIDRHPGEA